MPRKNSPTLTQLMLESPAFAAGAQIPLEHTGEGKNISPPLHWSGVPAEARTLALICEDPDAPGKRPFVHWVLFNLPAEATSLPAHLPAMKQMERVPGARHAFNDFDSLGYRGPMPPRGDGVHHYHFRLFALDAKILLPPAATRDELLRAMRDHIVGEGELVGLYERA